MLRLFRQRLPEDSTFLWRFFLPFFCIKAGRFSPAARAAEALHPGVAHSTSVFLVDKSKTFMVKDFSILKSVSATVYATKSVFADLSPKPNVSNSFPPLTQIRPRWTPSGFSRGLRPRRNAAQIFGAPKLRQIFCSEATYPYAWAALLLSWSPTSFEGGPRYNPAIFPTWGGEPLPEWHPVTFLVMRRGVIFGLEENGP